MKGYMNNTQNTTLTLDALPALGAKLDDGIFVGLTTTEGSAQEVIVLLPDRCTGLNWEEAKEWAASVGGSLPTRIEAALLFANAMDHLHVDRYWTSQDLGASWAWSCDLRDCTMSVVEVMSLASAVAIRRISLSV